VRPKLPTFHETATFFYLLKEFFQTDCSWGPESEVCAGQERLEEHEAYWNGGCSTEAEVSVESRESWTMNFQLSSGTPVLKA